MKLGQHFLVDERIAERQIKYANLNSNDIVLEIGAGSGILTKKIAEFANVIAIEIDKKFIENLKKIDNVVVINSDAMDVDFNELDFNKVISNLPYQISSPITFKLLEKKFTLAILMYQKEFAERLVAGAGNKNYSRLSVMAYYKADWKILEEVPRHAFCPIPKVSSCIVSVKPIGKRFDVDEKAFSMVVGYLFRHRRKKIKNALKLEGLDVEKMPFADMRVEKLQPEEIAELTNFLVENGFF